MKAHPFLALAVVALLAGMAAGCSHNEPLAAATRGAPGPSGGGKARTQAGGSADLGLNPDYQPPVVGSRLGGR